MFSNKIVNINGVYETKFGDKKDNSDDNSNHAENMLLNTHGSQITGENLADMSLTTTMHEKNKWKTKKKSDVKQVIEYCTSQLSAESPLVLPRKFVSIDPSSSIGDIDNVVVMQWNILSQVLGMNYDRFDTCAIDDWQWSQRKWKIILQILQYSPIDVICLQEVDCFTFLAEILAKLGYKGIFVPKPDSPCNYITGNTGPDGCAIFWQINRISLINYSKRVLKVCQYPSNQVAVCAHFRHNQTNNEFRVCTTHLKARKGAILSALRNEQGKDLLRFLFREQKTLPLIVTGDFNAEPNEQVYKTITSRLSSAYKDGLGKEPLYTTWTKREGEKEMRQTLDYVFYDKRHLKLCALLSCDSDTFSQPMPNLQYPSDHISLAASFKFTLANNL